MSKGYDHSSKQKGFSLIEIIIAMVIFALVVVTLAPLLGMNFKQIIASGNRSIATYASQEDIEDTTVTGTSAGAITLKFTGNSGTKDVTINGYNEYVKGSLLYLALAPDATEITTASVTGFVAPNKDAAPISVGSLAANDTTYTVTSLTWSPTDNPYKGATNYTANVVLTSAAGYKFPTSGLTPSVNPGTPEAGTVSGGDVSGNTLTFNVTFPVTATTSIATAGVTGFVAPVKDAGPQAAGSLTPNAATYTVTGLTWSPTDNPYKGATFYTATVALTAATGYKFPTSGLTPSVNTGTTATGTTSGGDVSGNILSFNVTFPVTATTTIPTAGVTGFVAPVKNGTPQLVGTLVPNASTYTVTSLTWIPADSKFRKKTIYKAEVVLTAATGYKFPDGLTPSVNTGTAAAGTTSGGDVSGNKLTFRVTFPTTN